MQWADREALHECLRVWYAPLRALGALEPRVEDESPGRRSAPRTLWVQCGRGLADGSISVECLEGLVALTLLGRVDAIVWIHIIKEIWGDDPTGNEELRSWIDYELVELTTGRRAETFALGVIFVVHGPQDLKHLVAQRVNLAKCREHLRNAMELMKVTSEDEVLRVPVACFLGCSEQGNDHVSRSLKKILNIVTSNTKPGAPEVQFEIVDVRQYGTEPDMKALLLLQQLRRAGVRIYDLPELRPFCRSHSNANALVPAMHSLLISEAQDLTQF